MRAVVRKDLKRKAQDPSKATAFRLRKRPVPAQRIERYMSRNHILDGDTISEAGMLVCSPICTLATGDKRLATPSDFSCESPRSLIEDDAHPLVQDAPDISFLSPQQGLNSSLAEGPTDDKAWEAITTKSSGAILTLESHASTSAATCPTDTAPGNLIISDCIDVTTDHYAFIYLETLQRLV